MVMERGSLERGFAMDVAKPVISLPIALTQRTRTSTTRMIGRTRARRRRGKHISVKNGCPVIVTQVMMRRKRRELQTLAFITPHHQP
jgi:hypothetical protein